MIEEELLVQRGIELNLHKKDIGVRKEMITQVIDFIIQVEDNQIKCALLFPRSNHHSLLIFEYRII